MTLTFNLPTHEFFFTQNPNLKKNCVCGGEGGGGHKESKAKRNWGGGGAAGRFGGVSGGGGRCTWMDWTDEQAQTNLPLQLLRSWEHNNALMYNLCP